MAAASERPHSLQQNTLFAILLALSLSHLLNDLLQSLIPAVYPLLKESFQLTYTQVGLITLTFQLTASLLQPLVGLFTDRYPQPYSLATGMTFTLVGLILLAMAGSFPAILVAVGLVGIGSSVFHPESSRMARVASGGRHGLAQSLFQVGGNAGTSLGPLLAAFIVVPLGQRSIGWFSIAAIMAISLLFWVGRWYSGVLNSRRTTSPSSTLHEGRPGLSRARVGFAIATLLCLIFSKYFYLASLGSYYTFYLISKFGLSVPQAQVYLFIFLGSVAAGTIAGGPIGDRLGYKFVIWASILGVLPFTLALPYAGLVQTAVLTVPIGMILASAFPAILVYAQELLPRRVGTVAGLFFGFAFGMAGLGAAVLGWLADRTSIDHVYHLCSFLPLIGLLTAFLPNLDKENK
jgi:FSR family fosmidomycin resistance protein-like MFS transporter